MTKVRGDRRCVTYISKGGAEVAAVPQLKASANTAGCAELGSLVVYSSCQMSDFCRWLVVFKEVFVGDLVGIIGSPNKVKNPNSMVSQGGRGFYHIICYFLNCYV